MIEELEKQDMDDMRALLATPEGARFFCRLLDECGVDRPSYLHHDPNGTLYREGMRNIGLWLQAQIRGLDGERAILKARDERVELYERGDVNE